MAMGEREQFSSQVDPTLLTRVREIAANDGREFDAVLEDALRMYTSCRSDREIRPEVMVHFWNSVEKNRGLMELLAQHDSHGPRNGEK